MLKKEKEKDLRQGLLPLEVPEEQFQATVHPEIRTDRIMVEARVVKGHKVHQIKATTIEDLVTTIRVPELVKIQGKGKLGDKIQELEINRETTIKTGAIPEQETAHKEIIRTGEDNNLVIPTDRYPARSEPP